MFSLTGTVDVLFSNKFFGRSYSDVGFCLNKAYLFSNKTEDPSVPYAGQGYIRVLSKIHKRCKPSKTPYGPLRN